VCSAKKRGECRFHAVENMQWRTGEHAVENWSAAGVDVAPSPKHQIPLNIKDKRKAPAQFQDPQIFSSVPFS